MKRPIESEYNSYAAYTRALEIYCDDDDIQTYQRPWVGLTDEETETLIHRFDGDPHTLLDEVNARLKEKNT